MGRKFVVPPVILSVLPKPSTKVLRQPQYVSFNIISSQSLLTCVWCFWKTSVYLLPSKDDGNILITLSHYTKWLPLYSIKPGSGWSVHDLPGIVGAQLFPVCVRVSRGVWEVEGGMVVALLKCFPMHDSVKRTVVPEADCHPWYRRGASVPLIDSGRGHSLTLSLHIKGLLSEGDSQWGYIT